MTTWSVVTVVMCAHIAVAVQEGKIKEPQLHEHPTLVAMVQQNNYWRNQSGLSSQRISPYLMQLAQAHANWMASTGRFEHNYNHPYPEIIYWNAADIQSAFSGWMNSGPHRAIMLSGNTHCGFGYAVAASGEQYWCGVYGSFQEEVAEPAVEQASATEPAQEN